MRYFFLLPVLIFIALTQANAQSRCSSNEYLQSQLQQDPTLQQRMQAIEQHTQQYATQPTAGQRAVITIPVVVHVVYNTTAQNVSDAQIQSQITQLNLDYRKLNTDWTSTPSGFQSLVADYEIEFCLATRDPNGNSTNGIIRKQTSSTSFSTNDNVKRTANGGDDAWPSSSYLNLWVCNLSGGTLGYAQFPGGAAATDGVVINYTAFGTIGTAASPYNKGRTATHEVGHWLNLYHIWGDDGTSCNGSDNVNDTPNQADQHYGCPNFPQVSCSNGPNGDMFMNYMDYTDDACMYMFTAGQKARSSALFATGGSRASLLNSLGCAGVNTPPVANFTADNTTSCTGVIQFTNQTTGGATSWLWNFGDGSTSTQQSPSHTYTTNGTYTVTLTATNANGNDVETKSNYIVVNKPTAPAVNNAGRCGTGTVTLTTPSTDVVNWYATNTSTTVLGTGSSFTTPSISTTTTYYAEASVTGASYNAGKPTNSGNGGYLNSSWYMVFNVLKPCTLESVYVYANGAGNRTFELQNSAGAVISTLTVNVPTGGSRVTLNFPLTAGTGYRLGLPTGTTINLYRNNAGATYPYTDAGGYVSITGNNAGSGATGYYYYMYDWILKAPSCVSQRTAAVATVNPAITLANPTVTNAGCSGNANGSVSVSASGGTPAFSYNWSSGQTSATITNLAGGTYTVTVTDTKNCSATAIATVTQAAAISATPVSVPVSCSGGNNGSVSVTLTGGTPTYNYQWSNGTTAATATNLTPGNYTVTITDAGSCSVTASATVAQPAILSLSATATGVSCFGGNNGSATATATGGTPNYSYAWSNGGSAASAANLPVGNYAITVTDSKGCSATFGGSISQPSAISASVSTTSSACGQSNGTAAVTATGGTGNLSYVWNTGATTASISNAAAGNYTVTITDNNNCTATATAIVNSTGGVTATTSATNVNCNGGSTGSVSTNISTGVQPYSYLWSTGAQTASISNIPAGTYTVTITDGTGCASILNVAVTQPAALNATTGVTNSLCGSANGAVALTVTGGTGSYSYSWNTGAVSSSVSNLPAGTYTATVTDANNCITTVSATVNNNGGLPVTGIASNVSCNGGTNGSATISVSGGTTPYTYSWSTGANTAAINGLTAGGYAVTVTDASGCAATASVTVAQPGQLTPAVTATNTLCGTANGSVSATVTGGTGNYNYLWSNGSNAATLSNVAAGSYTVTITDGNNCTATALGIVNAAGNLNVTTTLQDVACNGGNNGSAGVTVITGTAPYSYVWSNGAQTATANNLTAGTYLVTVTDNSGCQRIETFVIAQPAPLAVTVNTTNTSCGSTNNGVAFATISGGTPGYSYNWSTGSTATTVTSLSAGNYSLTISDVNQCTVVSSFTVIQQNAPAVSISTTNVQCNGSLTGTAVAVVTGGSPNYSFVWSNGTTFSSVLNVGAGTYTLTVTDGNNCTSMASAVVTEPTPIQFTASSSDATIGQADGSASVSNITGGTAPYTLEWSNSTTANPATGLAGGLYSVTVYDANGCEKTAFVVVNEAPTGVEEVLTSIHFNVFPNPAADEVMVLVSEVVTEGLVTVKNMLGQEVLKQAISEQTTRLRTTDLSEGVYFVEVTAGNSKAVKQLLINH